jgi:hypothetical protein
MRQLLAMTVAFLIGLPVFAPLFPGTSAIVPVCCRRGGQHHCMSAMMSMDDASGQSSDHGVALVAPKCPRCPMASVVPPTLGFVAGQDQSAGIALYVRPASLPQTQARYRIAFARSRQKRGPPALLS